MHIYLTIGLVFPLHIKKTYIKDLHRSCRRCRGARCCWCRTRASIRARSIWTIIQYSSDYGDTETHAIATIKWDWVRAFLQTVVFSQSRRKVKIRDGWNQQQRSKAGFHLGSVGRVCILMFVCEHANPRDNRKCRESSHVLLLFFEWFLGSLGREFLQ